MKLGLIVFSAFLATLPMAIVPAWGQGDAHAPAAIIVCPASAMIGVTGEQIPQGWTSLLKPSASFKKAEVVNGVGLEGPTLACSYALGETATEEIARLSRPEPAGMLCSVNAAKGAQFDCFARPGTDQMHTAPATRP